MFISFPTEVPRCRDTWAVTGASKVCGPHFWLTYVNNSEETLEHLCFLSVSWADRLILQLVVALSLSLRAGREQCITS